MIRVKVTTGFPDWPLVRQTPGSRGEWDGCRFFIDDSAEECDCWVVVDALPARQTARCPRGNTILITQEPESIRRYPDEYVRQFGQVITCQERIRHARKTMTQQGLSWWVGARYDLAEKRWAAFPMGYDEFKNGPLPEKTRLVSVICSDKTFTAGHARRFGFVKRLQEELGDQLDVFGRGVREVADKWDAIAPYRYHIAIENCRVPHYWTEKLADCLLAGAYPLYCGCPNIFDYFPAGSLAAFDLSDPAKAIAMIKDTIAGNAYEASRDSLAQARDLVLDRYNIFALMASLVKALPMDGERESVTLNPQDPRTMIAGGLRAELLRRRTLRGVIRRIKSAFAGAREAA